MKKILVIGYVWPEPNSSAAGSRMMQLLTLFKATGWKVVFSSPAQRTEHMFDLASLGIDSVDIALNCSSFDRFINDYSPHMVMFDRFMMEEQFGWRVETQCPQSLRVLNTEDLHSLRLTRHQALKQQRPVTQADLNGPQAQREIAAIFRSDLTLMISEYEVELLHSHYKVPKDIVHYSPFMLAPYHLSHQEQDFTRREHFISIGNFRHAPNWDAVLWLKQEIWPLMREQLPEAELHVYGAYPPPKATQLHNPKQGFLVKGWADDAFEVMKQARVCIAPLRFGAGIKGKLVDAMQCGTPNVTTQIGAEAMAGDCPWSGLIGESAQDIAQHSVDLYQNEELWKTMQQRGYDIISTRFDKEAIQHKLVKKLELSLANCEKNRTLNFTGAMLRHHQHKSTQYMAQWIEAKNKLKGNQ